MRSVADAFRADTRRKTLDLRVDQRIERALSLGDDDAALFAAVHAMDDCSAKRALARSRQTGRRQSCAAEPRS